MCKRGNPDKYGNPIMVGDIVSCYGGSYVYEVIGFDVEGDPEPENIHTICYAKA